MDTATLAILVTLLSSAYYIGSKLGNIENWLKNHMGDDGPHARLDITVAKLQRRVHRLESQDSPKENGAADG